MDELRPARQNERKVVIVGAGISGLVLAYRCRSTLPNADENQLTIVEKLPRAGGTTWTELAEGFRVETGPNGFLTNKPDALELCYELGLEAELRPADPQSKRRFIFLGDRLRPLPSTLMEFLTSDLLPFSSRLRVLAEPFIPRKKSEHDESIFDFGVRRLGKRATEVFLDTVVTGIHAGDPSRLSLAGCFPMLAELERKYGSLILGQLALAFKNRPGILGKSPLGQKNQLVAPEAGMGRLISALGDTLARHLRVGIVVSAIERLGKRWQLFLSDDTRLVTETVCLSCPAFEQARLLKPFAPSLSDELERIEYSPAVVCALGFRKSEVSKVPNGFGYLAPESLGRAVLGVQFISSISPDHSPSDCHHLRAILGGSRRHDVLDWDDDKIVSTVRDDLKQSIGITAEPAFRWIYRWPKGIPQYCVGHHARLARLERELSDFPGLFLGGNAHRGVAFNDCIRDASYLAEKITHYLHPSKTAKI